MTAVVGDELAPTTIRITRADLIAYAGASGDHNVIHYSDRIATAVGLPGVIAHGMYTMAVVGRVVTAWAGDPAAVTAYTVRFARPVPVPDDDLGAELVVGGRVEAVDAEAGTATLVLTATVDGVGVLTGARATVRL